MNTTLTGLDFSLHIISHFRPIEPGMGEVRSIAPTLDDPCHHVNW